MPMARGPLRPPSREQGVGSGARDTLASDAPSLPLRPQPGGFRHFPTAKASEDPGEDPQIRTPGEESPDEDPDELPLGPTGPAGREADMSLFPPSDYFSAP